MQNKNMYIKEDCPLCYSFVPAHPDGNYSCAGSECRWWWNDECAIVTIAKSLYMIAKSVKQDKRSKVVK